MRAVAEILGAREGTVVKDKRTGSVLIPPGFVIVTIRRGEEDEVTEQLLVSAARAGYTGHRLVPGGPQRSWEFQQQGGLPYLSVETFPAGKEFRGGGAGPIPAGHTGVVVSLG
jgi:hypothetical protein